MLKDKKIDLNDTNCALIGTDIDKKCREAAAAGEKAWEVAGKKPGMQIWRIEKFKVKKSQTRRGVFYKDDSYICLNTYKKKDAEGKELDKLGFDVHFWIGSTSSQDEYGTAAYKTVELDDFLGGDPVQHRECCGFESKLFCSYFEQDGGIQLLEGGIESGFNKVKPKEFKPRLLHLKGRKNIRIEQVDFSVGALNSGDVFVLDKGMDIYQWQGKKAGKNEKARAGQYCRCLDDERSGKPEVHVFSQGDSDELEFFSNFPGVTSMDEVKISDDAGDDLEHEKESTKALYQLSDQSGSMQFNLIAEGKVTRDMLKSDDVFIFDIGSEVYAWVGKGSSKGEKSKALEFAQHYLKMTGKPKEIPTCKIFEGANCEIFDNSFDKA